MKGQMTMYDFLDQDEMYDGYKAKKSKTIDVVGNRTSIKKDSICYLVCRHKDGISIAFPNDYGGSFGFCVTMNQFNELFIKLDRKVYPKSKEIWNGKNWVPNPSSC